MPLESDIVLNPTNFLPGNVSDETKKMNAMLEHISTTGPKWFEVGAAKYRRMWEAGETPLPKPVYLPNAKDAVVPSREKGCDIEIRVYAPDNGELSKGVLLHFHGGGFVIGSQKYADISLQRYANHGQLTGISVGYRLAPEHPFPAAIEDCFDAAEYLVDHAEKEYGAPLLFAGGESAGASLAVSTAFHLHRARPTHRLAGLILPFGYYDLTHNSPQASSFTRHLVINYDTLEHFAAAYVPGKSIAERRNPLISPLYEDMHALVTANTVLLPALFLCGTADPLLDDSILLSTKWMATGSEAILKIYPGAPHAFVGFPGVKVSDDAIAAIIHFVKEKTESMA